MKKVTFYFVAFLFIFGIAAVSFAQETPQPATSQQMQEPQTQSTPEPAKTENKNIIKGLVKEVAKDKTYIVVDTTKILTTQEFLDDSYLEVGDKVEITVENTDAGPKAVSYNYIFEEDPSEDLGVKDMQLEETGTAN
ncbi:MAG: hypothetical protein PHQ96_02805 [Candidatus Omnitrophica bacterium]|nr:hypothetical protein [Candidatus Omnitrophota bacterium]